MKRNVEVLGIVCRLLHGPADLMHPVNGVVRCRRCHCQFPVAWGPIPKPQPDIPAALLPVGLITAGRINVGNEAWEMEPK